ncbi:MAG: undecaprenyldiphospho-muramoylpentapeptide beta-N-acetylglucosaminyltransferase [Wenzhouxiangellaceae bacterium]
MSRVSTAHLEGRQITILAGGTGGHIFPGLAVAERLLQAGAMVRWLGTPAGLENRLVPAAGIALDRVRVHGLRGRGLAGWLLAPLMVLRALWASWRILGRHRPDCVLSMGGYVAGPAGLAARLRRSRLVIHEQNAVAGLTNRCLRPLANAVCCAFPGALRGAVVTGNPVRPGIEAIPAPAIRFRDRRGPLRLLVIGGSQGAAIFNQVVPEALARLPESLRPEVRHQAGRQLQLAKQNYQKAGVAAEVTDFVDDMAAAWAWADLAVCRAGALTVSELAAAGVASVLVPLPTAVDDHQTANARYLADHGAAWLMPQSGFGPVQLAELIAGLDRERLLKRAEAARRRHRPGAAQAVVEAIAEVLR